MCIYTKIKTNIYVYLYFRRKFVYAMGARFKSEIDRRPVVTCRNPGSVSYSLVNSRSERENPDEYITLPKNCDEFTS